MYLKFSLRSCALTMIMSCLSIVGAFGSEPTLPEVGSQLNATEQSQYLSKLRREYGVKSDRQALLLHINELLRRYALKSGYKVGLSDETNELFQISVERPGILVVKETKRSSKNQWAVQQKTLMIDVYGVDPFIHYVCAPKAIRCVILNPINKQSLISIVRVHEGAAELAKSMSFLIRNLQK